MAIKFAFDDRHLCCNCITKDYSMAVLLIDAEAATTLGVTDFSYSIPFKIKDLAFFPNSTSRFVTCGI
jgi:hypothetical protein